MKEKLYLILEIILFITLFLFIGFNYKQEINIDMNIISKIESNNNPQAYNEGSGARGLFQITDICLEDFNQYHLKKYRQEDLFNKEINTLIAKWYIQKRIPYMLEHYNLPLTIDNLIICYNVGISYLINSRELPEETKEYIKKYKKYLKNE